MGKKNQIYEQIQAAIRQMQNPAANPAQNWLTTEALAGAEVFKKGDFTQLPKGMFFNFKNPVEQREQYKKLTNVGDEGTFALGAGAGGGEGAGRAMDTKSQYLNDRFARDASQNYQENVSMASDKIKNALGQASGYTQQNQNSVLSGLQNLYGSVPTGGGWLGGLLSSLGGIGAAAITKW